MCRPIFLFYVPSPCAERRFPRGNISDITSGAPLYHAAGAATGNCSAIHRHGDGRVCAARSFRRARSVFDRRRVLVDNRRGHYGDIRRTRRHQPLNK